MTSSGTGGHFWRGELGRHWECACGALCDQPQPCGSHGRCPISRHAVQARWHMRMAHSGTWEAAADEDVLVAHAIFHKMGFRTEDTDHLPTDMTGDRAPTHPVSLTELGEARRVLAEALAEYVHRAPVTPLDLTAADHIIDALTANGFLFLRLDVTPGADDAI